MKIHREGWTFAAAPALVGLVLLAVSPWAGAGFLAVALAICAFFRDPERKPPTGDGLILSPADGRLLPILNAVPPPELGLGGQVRTRLSVFMSVFDVHVNRVPADGVISTLAYRPGKFFNASFDKASEHNERMAVRMALDGPDGSGRGLAFVQIAGLVARRIHCELSEGQRVCRGDRFGIIRFGSRLDIYLPDGARVRANAGQRVRAGETVLADFPQS